MSLLDADNLVDDESPEISWDDIPWDQVDASHQDAIAGRKPFTYSDEADAAISYNIKFI